MSVKKIKKLTVFTLKEDIDRITEKILLSRLLHFETTDRELPRLTLSETDTAASQVADKDRLLCAIELLSKYAGAKIPPAQSKIEADIDVFRASKKCERALALCEEALSIASSFDSLDSESDLLEKRTADLLPWETYGESLSLRGTLNTSLFLGSLPSKVDIEEIMQSLADYSACLHPISLDESFYYVRVIVQKDEAERTLEFLGGLGFVSISFEGIETSAKAELERARKRLITIEGDKLRMDERLSVLATDLDLLKIYYDLLCTAEKCEELKRDFYTTKECVCFDGWILAESEEELIRLLDRYDCAYEISDPTLDDDAPVTPRSGAFASKKNKSQVKVFCAACPSERFSILTN